jgi:NitT/TauT family transport system substrate-binding protein
MFEGGRLQEATQLTRQLLLGDMRHGRIIREDLEINSQPIAKATKNWKL